MTIQLKAYISKENTVKFVEETPVKILNVFEASSIDCGEEAERLIAFYYGTQEVSVNGREPFQADQPWDQVFYELKELNSKKVA